MSSHFDYLVLKGYAITAFLALTALCCILLRYRAVDDLEGILALRNDPLVQRTQTFSAIAPAPSSKYKEYMKTFAEGSALWFSLVHKDSLSFIGFCCINLLEAKNRDARLGITIASEFWGKGYGTEVMHFTVNHAFKYFGLQRISLDVTEGNARARAVYAKLGFKVEGRKRRGNWVDGHWEDIIYMGFWMMNGRSCILKVARS
ncbi:acyl-CoA N-acyltransferase [Suillus cothurnatus]|nr:acyl-CoA N-acyltransferase [Suillus cothurnatus]